MKQRRSRLPKWLPPIVLTIGCGVWFLTLGPFAQAQTYSVVFSFYGPSTGLYPVSGVTVDGAGNLYGTTSIGGPGTGCYEGCGTAFKLSHRNNGWL